MQVQQHNSRQQWEANPKEMYVAREAQAVLNKGGTMEDALSHADSVMEGLFREEQAVVAEGLKERYLRAMAHRLLASTASLNRQQLVEMIAIGPIGQETPFDAWAAMVSKL